jgi:hypothetical protein
VPVKIPWEDLLYWWTQKHVTQHKTRFFHIRLYRTAQLLSLLCVVMKIFYCAMWAGCAIGVNDMRNPLRPVLRAMPFLPEVMSRSICFKQMKVCP